MRAAFSRAFAGILRNAWGSPVLNAGALLAFGILIPRKYGMDFLDIRLVLAYAFIPMLFVAPAVTSAMRAGQPARGPVVELYAQIAAIVLYGWVIGLVVMGMGLVTVNLVYRPPEVLLPSPGVLPAYVLFCFSAVGLVAALGAYIALLFSPLISLNTLRFGFFVLLLFFYGGASWLPPSWQVSMATVLTEDGFPKAAMLGSACLLVFAGGLLGAMRARGS